MSIHRKEGLRKRISWFIMASVFAFPLFGPGGSTNVWATHKNYTLKVKIKGKSGATGMVKIDPPGTICSGKKSCKQIYKHNSVVKLTAVPGVGSVFKKWSSDCAGTSATTSTTSITMNKDRQCTADFNPGAPPPPLPPPSGSGTIRPEGGEITLDSVAKVIFPQGAFPSDTQVTVTTSNTAEVAAAFNDFASIFRPASRLTYEIRINTGLQPPVSDTIRVEIAVPDDFLNAVPADHQIELFAQLLTGGSDETIDLFEIFDAAFNASTKTIIADLPTAVFSNTRNSVGDFEAIIILAPTPGINRTVSAISPLSFDTMMRASLSLAATASACKAASIQCPLSMGCTVNSPFNPARKHPVTGEVKPHTGVDYFAPSGSSVVAAAAGTVETSAVVNGYGETIVIRHADGSATLYGHLQQRNVVTGIPVTKGQNIAISGNTGVSTNPHLHFEYVPNGQIFNSKKRIDPDPCIAALASGSITVRDNGFLADDAFQVFLDNTLIGSTAIGASNTLAVNNLIPGNHQIRIVAIIAPDNKGTYEITLNDGLTFSGGGTSTSGVLQEGSSEVFTIVVPSQ